MPGALVSGKFLARRACCGTTGHHVGVALVFLSGIGEISAEPLVTHFACPDGVEESGPVALIHGGNTAAGSMDELLRCDLIDLEASEAGFDAVWCNVVRGGLGIIIDF